MTTVRGGGIGESPYKGLKTRLAIWQLEVHPVLFLSTVELFQIPHVSRRTISSSIPTVLTNIPTPTGGCSSTASDTAVGMLHIAAH